MNAPVLPYTPYALTPELDELCDMLAAVDRFRAATPASAEPLPRLPAVPGVSAALRDALLAHIAAHPRTGPRVAHAALGLPTPTASRALVALADAGLLNGGARVNGAHSYTLSPAGARGLTALHALDR